MHSFQPFRPTFSPLLPPTTMSLFEEAPRQIDTSCPQGQLDRRQSRVILTQYSKSTCHVRKTVLAPSSLRRLQQSILQITAPTCPICMCSHHDVCLSIQISNFREEMKKKTALASVARASYAMKQQMYCKGRQTHDVSALFSSGIINVLQSLSFDLKRIITDRVLVRNRPPVA